MAFRQIFILHLKLNRFLNLKNQSNNFFKSCILLLLDPFQCYYVFYARGYYYNCGAKIMFRQSIQLRLCEMNDIFAVVSKIAKRVCKSLYSIRSIRINNTVEDHNG